MTFIQTQNPATESLIERYSFETPASLETKLSHVRSGFLRWAAISKEERAGALGDLARALRAQKESLAALITSEMGKPLTEARSEVEKCATQAAYYANAGAAMMDDDVRMSGAHRSFVAYRPLGPILAVMPWNFPLWQVTRFAIPTWLAGNTVLLKHAPNVMGTAVKLTQIVSQVLGENILVNIAARTEDVAGLIRDPRIAAVSLTGSPRAGAAVAQVAGASLKKAVLELGGSDAFIVLNDADLTAAVQTAVRSRFGNNGQVCLAAKRFLLESEIAKEFTERFCASVAALCVGDPTRPETNQGPMARVDLRDELQQQVARTLASGARQVFVHEAAPERGFFYPPTVLDRVAPNMAGFSEETFGPVACLMTVNSAEHAVAVANQSDYGLSSTLFTTDLERAQRLVPRIEAGAVFINALSASDPRLPVGGIRKSGYGRELAEFGPKEFCNTQAVSIGALPPLPL